MKRNLLCLTIGIIATFALNAQLTLEPGIPGTLENITPDDITLTVEQNYKPGDDNKKLVVVGNLLFFTAVDSVNYGEELWVTDGTKDGAIVLDINEGVEGSSPNHLCRVGNKVVFSAFTEEAGTELWMTDGTPEGTEMIADIYPGSTGSNPEFFSEFNGKMLFRAQTEVSALDEKFYLFVSDLTETGTKPISATEPQGLIDSNTKFILPAGSKAFFVGETEEWSKELWRTDGTEEGTYMVLDITPGNEPSFGTKPYEWLKVINDSILWFRAETRAFWVYDPDTIQDGDPYKQVINLQYEPWISDGTASGTYCIQDLNYVIDGTDPTKTGNTGAAFPTAYNGQVIFRATDPVVNNEPLYTDYTPGGIKVLADLNRVNADNGLNVASWSTSFTLFDSKVFFRAHSTHDADSTKETPSGIGIEQFYVDENLDLHFTTDLNPGIANNKTGFGTVVNGRMYQLMQDADNNSELFRTLPASEAAGYLPEKVADAADDGKPHNLIDMNGELYFILESTNNLYKYSDEKAEKVGGYIDPLAFGPDSKGALNPWFVVHDTCAYRPEPCPDNTGFNNLEMVHTNLKVYPNPAHEYVLLDLDANKTAEVRIYDMKGVMVWSECMFETVQLDVSNYASGVYTVISKSDGKLAYQNLIIQ